MAGCGDRGDAPSGTVDRGDAGTDGPAHDDPVICSAAPGAPDAPALFLLVGSDVVAVDGHGTRRVIHHLEQPPEDVSLTVREHGVVVSAATWQTPGYSEVVAFDRAGQPLWRDLRFDAHGRPSEVILGAGGISVVARVDVPSRLRFADGRVIEMPAMRPLAVPGPDGWMPTSFTPEVHGFGFVHATTGEQRATSLPVAPEIASDPVWRNDRLVYFSGRPGEPLLLVDERPGAPRAQPIGLVAIERQYAYLHHTHDAALVIVDQRPRAVWRPDAPLRVLDLSGADDEPGRISTFASGDHALVTLEGRPRWLVDSSTAEVRSLAAGDAGPADPDVVAVSSPSGAYWVGSHDGAPRWQVEAATGSVRVIDLSPTTPLRPFTEGKFCAGRVRALDDGRIAASFRDDATAGWFVGSPGAPGWQRIGQPATGIAALDGVPLGGDAWLLVGNTLRNTYCYASADWASDAATPSVAGDAIQLADGGGTPTILHPPLQVHLDASRSCVLFSDGSVHDLAKHARASVGSFRLAAWAQPGWTLLDFQ